MSRKIIFATGNEGKMREIRAILADLGAEILSMKEAGIEIEIDENGSTFEENARIKAEAVAKYCGNDIVLAEDTPYEIKNQKLIERLEGVPREQRTARFVCAICAVIPGHEPVTVRGTIEGYIGWEPAGENGFGYDPIFYVPDLECSTAQLSMEEKNKRSHRGNALRKIKEELVSYI